MRRVLWTILILSSLLYVGCSSSTESSDIAAPVIKWDLNATCTAPVGSTVNLFVDVAGEAVAYKWQKVTLDINNVITKVEDIPNENADTLDVKIEATNNNENYRCIVSNEGGSDTSTIANIVVTSVEPIIYEDIKPVSGFEGSTFTLQINAVGYNLAYAWEEVVLDAEGAILSATPVSNQEQPSLTGIFSTESQNKSYRCIISNEAGSDTSSIATIYIPATTVDLAPYIATGATKSSRPAVMKSVGDKLYIGLQRLNDDWTATETSIVLVINTLSNTIVDTIITTGFNIGDMEVVGNYLYVVNTGSLYAHGDGKVERISLINHSIETVFEGTNDISNIEHYSGDQFFVASYSYDMVNFKGVTPVYLCDFTTDTFIDTVAGVENGQNLLYNAEEGLLYIGEAHGASRGEVKVYNPTTKTVTAIPTTLGVSSMAFYGTGSNKRVVLTESDYNTGYLGEIKEGAYTQKLLINDDAQVAVSGDCIFVLEKSNADNLMKVNPADYSVLYQKALTDKYNPYAVEIINGIGYILSYEFSVLNTFDIATGILK